MSVLFTLLFVVVPVTELILFVWVSDAVGLLNTLGLVLTTAFIGGALVRWQGLSVLGRFRTERDAGQFPGRQLVHGVLILVGGAFLLTPGFLTDTIGFSLMVPGFREWIRNRGERLIMRRTILFR